MVQPELHALSKAPNGAIREGNAQDVTVMQVGKGQDLQVSFTAVQRIEQRLQYAFLMAKAVQRDAERGNKYRAKNTDTGIRVNTWRNLLYPEF